MIVGSMHDAAVYQAAKNDDEYNGNKEYTV